MNRCALEVTKGDVTYHLLMQYNAVQPCSIVQVFPAVCWFPKNQKIVNNENIIFFRYIWNNTCNLFHFTCYTLGWIHILSKVALTVREGMCLGDFEEKYRLLSQWINYEALFKTTLSLKWSFNDIEFKIYVSNRSNNISVF